MKGHAKTKSGDCAKIYMSAIEDYGSPYPVFICFTFKRKPTFQLYVSSMLMSCTTVFITVPDDVFYRAFFMIWWSFFHASNGFNQWDRIRRRNQSNSSSPSRHHAGAKKLILSYHSMDQLSWWMVIKWEWNVLWRYEIGKIYLVSVGEIVFVREFNFTGMSVPFSPPFMRYFEMLRKISNVHVYQSLNSNITLWANN